MATALLAISNSSANSEKPGTKAQDAGTSASLPPQLVKPESDQSLSVQPSTTQSQVDPDAIQQTRPVPVLTMQNAPEVPVCREILNQDIIDLVNSSVEDPGEIFEANRRAHPHMIMMPPPTECASELWEAIRNPERAPVVPDLINSRQYSMESVYNMNPFAASVGSNTDLSSGVEGYQGENSISINPNNPQQLIAHSNTFFRDTTAQCQHPTGGAALTFGTMALFGSTDGGQTWKYNCAPWHTSVNTGVTSANAYFGSDPALAWDASGNAYACYMLLSQNSSGQAGASIVVAKSTDVGQTWQQLGSPVVNRINVTTALDDKQMMAIDTTSGQTFSHPGRMYIIWDEGNVERVAYSDTGAAWTTVLLPSGTAAIGGNVVIGADGTVYSIWTRYNVETIVFSKSTDGGATWTAPSVIATLALQSFGSNNLPPAQDQRGINGFGAIDVDKNPASASFGNLYVSFTDFPAGTTSGADLNTYVIRSTNGGTSWSTRVKVNDDNFGATQIFPWLAVDQSDGTVNVSWIDSRLDPINRKTQAVYARSSDGGLSFEPNILVTDGGVNWRNNANYSDENSTDNTTYNGNQYGDYTGIAAFNRQVHPLWTDSRMFFPVADTQAPTRREDNATSTVINCSSPGTVVAPTVNSSTAPNVAVSWGAPDGWGTNATNGTYSVYRNTTAVFPGGSPLASGLTSTSYVDTTGVNGTTYFYFVRAKNNCPGTALTPMSTDSPASTGVVFGSAGTATGVLQGTVMSGASAVSGAIVTAGTFSATTNASGFYQIPGISAGTYTVSTSPAGYSPASVNGVVVSDNATTVQDLTLTPNSASNCYTDTTFGDYSVGLGTGVDIASSPGDVKLAGLGSEAVDQSNTPTSFFSAGNITSTAYLAQTFTAGKTGQLTKATFGMGLASGTSGTVTVEVRGTTSGAPNATVLATTTMGPITNVGTVSVYTATFTVPATVTTGTVYAFVLRPSTGNTAFGVRGSGNQYASGALYTSANAGSTWTATTNDFYFAGYVKPTGLQTSGNFVSSVKDSGAVTGATTNWGTITWNNASLPAGTTLQFQVAGSNSASGPFNFVGSDGTAATFFTTSGASLSQFNGKRYLKYKALFTGNGTLTPTLNDVTVCFNTAASTVTTALTASPATGTYGGTVNLSATLTDGTNGIGGKLISFTLNGTSVGSASTTASGVATVSNVSLAGISPGSYPTGVGASYAGDSGYTASNSTAALTVNKANTTTAVTVSNATYDGNPHGGSASVTGPAGLNQSLTVSYTGRNSTVYGPSNTAPTNAGEYTASASYAGDSNYNPSSDSKDYQIAKASQTISFGALADKTYGDPDFNVSATATSGLAVSFNASGACSVTGNTVHITGGGSCTITASQAGDANYSAAADVPQSFNIAKANQTITFNPLGDKTYGDADFTVSASASSSLAVSFGAIGNCTVTGDLVHITGGGSCTITASQAGDVNYNAATNVDRSFNIAKASASVSLSNLSQTYDGTPKSATATTNPVGLNVNITYGPRQSARKSTVAANPTDAGSYSVTATIDDPNYVGTASDTLVIAKANATIAVSGYSGAYDGSPHGATGTATGAQSEDLSSLLHLGASYTNVPGGTANWTFDGDSNYNSDSGSVSITITKATPTINWSNPANINYGTALGATQLNAVASTAGAYVYTPAAGTVLSAGNGQNLHVAFTPTDTTNYNNATADVSINVLSAVLSVSMTADRNPAPVGLNFNYKVLIANTGNASSTNTVLTDVLPTQVTFTAATSTQGSCAYNSVTRTVTCNIGAITPGSTITVTMTVKPRDEGTLNNTANVTAGQWDPATGNSSASVNGLQSQKIIDLSVSKVDSADPIFVGNNTTYTMVVKNSNTEINATGVALTDTLPSGVTFVSATTSQGSLVTPPVGSTGIVTGTLGTLAPNATATVTVTVKGATPGVWTNTAQVSANESDSNTANNTATQSTTVKAVVVVNLQKVLLAKQVLTGGCENTTGNVYLTAPAPAGGVTVTLSSNISGASVPASVDIAAGQMVSPAFTVTTSQIATKQVGLITATSGPNSVSRNLTINVGNGTCPP